MSQVSLSRELVKKRALRSFNGMSYSHWRERSSLTDTKPFPRCSVHGPVSGGKTSSVYTQNPLKRSRPPEPMAAQGKPGRRLFSNWFYMHVYLLPKSVSWNAGSHTSTISQNLSLGRRQTHHPAWAGGGRNWGFKGGRRKVPRGRTHSQNRGSEGQGKVGAPRVKCRGHTPPTVGRKPMSRYRM